MKANIFTFLFFDNEERENMTKITINIFCILIVCLSWRLTLSKTIIFTPIAGLCNQLMALGHAMSVANITNRDLQVAGMRASFDEQRVINADLIIDLQHLQDKVAPLMGITKPNFTVSVLTQNVSKECIVSKIETNKDVLLQWITDESSYGKCDAIELKHTFFHTGSGGFNYLGVFLQRFIFSSQIRDIALKYRETVLMDCYDALVIHYRVESDMMAHAARWDYIRVGGKPVKDRQEVEKIFIRGYQEAANSTLSKVHHLQCVYICTDAKGQIVEDYKTFLHSIKPSLNIYANSVGDLSEKEKGSLFATHGKDREIRAAVDFEIAFLIAKHLIGTKYSTFSNTLRVRMGGIRGGHVDFIDQYLPQA